MEKEVEAKVLEIAERKEAIIDILLYQFWASLKVEATHRCNSYTSRWKTNTSKKAREYWRINRNICRRKKESRKWCVTQRKWWNSTSYRRMIYSNSWDI